MTKKEEAESMVPASQVDQVYDMSMGVSRGVIAVIDTLVIRGSFRGEEMSTVGQLRDQCLQLTQLCETYHSMKESSEG